MRFMNERTSNLLRLIAAELEQGSVPLNPEFLVEHGVTFDECISLTTEMGMILRGYTFSPLQTQESMASVFAPFASGHSRLRAAPGSGRPARPEQPRQPDPAGHLGVGTR